MSEAVPEEPPPGTFSAIGGDARVAPDELAELISPITDGSQAARVGLDSPHGSAPPGRLQPASLTHRVGNAFVLSLANTLGSKVINLGLQIALAWILDQRYFGLIALVYTVTTFVGLLQQIGLRDVLIHRQRHFSRWANAAFWLCMASAVGAMALTCALAPAAASIYKRPELFKLLLVMAAMIPITNLSVVPAAKLSADLRFGFLCAFNIFSTALVAGLSILFAWRGFGAYSFVFPRLIESAVRAVVFWIAAPVPVRWNLQFKRWRFLLGDGLLVLAASAAFMLTSQGDNILLGLHAPDAIVGVYYFAFNLSMQGTMLLVGNLFEVLLPSLSSMDRDPLRQTDALLRALRAMCLVSVPFCLFQAATAAPIIHLFFGVKWQAAIPIVQVLAVGMSFHVLSWPAHGLVTAQGRFATNLLMAVLMGGGFLGIVYLFIAVPHPVASSGAWADPAFRTAIAVAIAYAISQPAYLFVAIRPAGRGMRNILSIAAGPYLASGLAILTALAIAGLAGRQGPGGEWLRLGIIVSVGSFFYFGLAWFFIPGTRQLVELGHNLVRLRVSRATR